MYVYIYIYMCVCVIWYTNNIILYYTIPPVAGRPKAAAAPAPRLRAPRPRPALCARRSSRGTRPESRRSACRGGPGARLTHPVFGGATRAQVRTRKRARKRASKRTRKRARKHAHERARERARKRACKARTQERPCTRAKRLAPSAMVAKGRPGENRALPLGI